MIHKLKRRVIMAFVTAAAIAGLIAVQTVYAETMDVSYVDANGQTQTVRATVLEDGSNSLAGGWYVVYSDIESKGIEVTGDNNLILADNSTLKTASINPGGSSSLTIYGQDAGTGELVQEGNSIIVDQLTVNGGFVTSIGRQGGGTVYTDAFAGIRVRQLEVNGGVVHSTGGDGLNNLNAASVAWDDTNLYGANGITALQGIVINGGFLSATGGSGGTAVNADENEFRGVPAYGGTAIDGDITIAGGNVTLSGGSAGAVNGVNREAGRAYNSKFTCSPAANSALAVMKGRDADSAKLYNYYYSAGQVASIDVTDQLANAGYILANTVSAFQLNGVSLAMYEPYVKMEAGTEDEYVAVIAKLKADDGYYLPGEVEVSDGYNILENGRDYEYDPQTGSFTGPSGNPNYGITITAKGIGDDMGSATVHTSQPMEPELTLPAVPKGLKSVMADSQELQSNVDYIGGDTHIRFTWEWIKRLRAGEHTVYFTYGNGFQNQYTITVIKSLSGTVKLSKTTYVYDGAAKKPTVSVAGLTSGRDYQVGYRDEKGNWISAPKSIGKYYAVADGIGFYEGSLGAAYKINPAQVAISKPVAGKKTVTVKWKKSAGGVKYQIAYKLKTSKKWKTTTSTATSKTIKKLKSKKYYNVRVRAYKKVGSTTYYGAWSKTKTVKVK